MERVFETPEPVHLFAEIGTGQVTINAVESPQSTVEITGERADEVVVEQDSRTISVIGPRQRSGFRRDPTLHVTVTVPTSSQLVVRTGGAGIAASGTFGLSELKSGSGNVEIETVEASAAFETGSGEITVGRVSENAWIKSGSGDIRVTRTMGAATIRVGSGDVDINHVFGAMSIKTGSGDLRVSSANGDVSMTSGSAWTTGWGALGRRGRAASGPSTESSTNCGARLNTCTTQTGPAVGQNRLPEHVSSYYFAGPLNQFDRRFVSSAIGGAYWSQ